MQGELIKKYKNLLIIIIILIVIGVFVYIFLPRSNNEKRVIKDNISPPASDTAQNTETENIAKPIETSTPVYITIKKPGEPPLPEDTDRFVVTLKDTNENIASNLVYVEYITSKNSFGTRLGDKDDTNTILSGAYRISKEMTDKQLLGVLKDKPYMKWVIIPEGMRKEEIVKILGDALSWSAKQKNDWINKDTIEKPEYIEGVYFPDTYLIPIDESPKNVANRLISKFNENFSFYLPEFTAKNIKWTTALTLASIVQREAANNADAPLIAGILWNRLNQKIALGVDATLQYIRGDTGNGWWAPISLDDKKIDSTFNTYMYKGLPPRPISNPGISAIDAILNPTNTDCLYYIHDKKHTTHCSTTYEEHLANIEKYLKNTE